MTTSIILLPSYINDQINKKGKRDVYTGGKTGATVRLSLWTTQIFQQARLVTEQDKEHPSSGSEKVLKVCVSLSLQI